jgi:hypothetical protein
MQGRQSKKKGGTIPTMISDTLSQSKSNLRSEPNPGRLKGQEHKTKKLKEFQHGNSI